MLRRSNEPFRQLSLTRMPQKITLVSVGKIKNLSLAQVIGDFEKKLGRYIQFASVETKDVKRSKKDSNVRSDEAKLILANLPSGAHVVVLDEKAKTRSTQKLVDWYDLLERRCIGHLVFVIGGPDGLDSSVLEQANESLSLSPMTFTHEIARFLLTEQLYRVLSFRAGHPYHRV